MENLFCFLLYTCVCAAAVTPEKNPLQLLPSDEAAGGWRGQLISSNIGDANYALNEILDGNEALGKVPRSQDGGSFTKQIKPFQLVPSNFWLWNPRKATSAWQFKGAGANSSSDPADRAGIWTDADSVQFVSVYVGQRNVDFNYDEAAVVLKSPIPFSLKDRVFLRRISKCIIDYSDEQSFFGVADPTDDPRLSNCNFFVEELGGSGLRFAVALTNKSIWAVIVRMLATESSGDAQQFIAMRRLVGRLPDDAVDIQIVVDNVEETVSFYAKGNKVIWTYFSVGVPPSVRDSRNIVSLGQGYSEAASMSKLAVGFGTGSFLDAKDPNSKFVKRLVKMEPKNDKFYNQSDIFVFDGHNGRKMRLGQTAVMKLYSLEYGHAEVGHG